MEPVTMTLGGLLFAAGGVVYKTMQDARRAREEFRDAEQRQRDAEQRQRDAEQRQRDAEQGQRNAEREQQNTEQELASTKQTLRNTQQEFEELKANSIAQIQRLISENGSLKMTAANYRASCEVLMKIMEMGVDAGLSLETVQAVVGKQIDQIKQEVGSVIQENLIDPVTLEDLKDNCVMAADGYTYNRSTLNRWYHIEGKRFCPFDPSKPLTDPMQLPKSILARDLRASLASFGVFANGERGQSASAAPAAQDRGAVALEGNRPCNS